MQKLLLSVPFVKQQHESDCLAACAAMVLQYNGHVIAHKQLLKLLKVRSFGTPGHNLRYLASSERDIIYRSGSMVELKQYLQQGLPIIVLVHTSELSYWSYATSHAVVVVGFERDTIFLNDPAFSENPIPVSQGDFELAWLMFDYRYGVIVER